MVGVCSLHMAGVITFQFAATRRGFIVMWLGSVCRKTALFSFRRCIIYNVT
jgi:hypothetical protein